MSAWKRVASLMDDDIVCSLWRHKAGLKSGMELTTPSEHKGYGAMGNQGFRFFDPRVAEAITLTGQYFIREVGNAIDEFAQKFSPDLKECTFYQDTDSVVHDTLIYVNGKQIAIGDYYDLVESTPSVTKNGTFVKRVSTDTSFGSVDGKSIIEEKIDYVMKHRVNKRLYTIKCAGEEVTITEDHSLMLLRNNTLISATVTDIKPGDKIVKLIKD